MGDHFAVVDKSVRSVFVGNIPYDVTEEKLKEIFSQVGPVLSFKLMYDRESGKPKGYGFCEYKDQETALSAMRNLNGFEIGGRPMRVDNACTEKSRMEMQNLMMGPVIESPYGPDCEPSKAPEAISNAVASLPPEQMYELMRQMKLCVRNNPAEARTMLMNNPQLAYALLQAQVVMRIVNPKIAVQILHGARENNDIGPIMPNSDFSSGPSSNSNMNGNGPPPQRFPPSNMMRPPMPGSGPPPGGHPFPQQPPPMPVPPPNRPPGHMPPFQGNNEFDNQMPMGGPRGPAGPHGPPGKPPGADHDMRMPPMSGPPQMGSGPLRDNHGSRDDRRHFGSDQDFRSAPPPPSGVPPPPGNVPPRGVPAPNLPAGLAGQDKEKASLIMQVLQLSDEQIRMLPPEQQQSILQLKEQITRSQNR